MAGLPHRTWIGVPVLKWLVVSGKAHRTWNVGLKMDCRDRFDRIDQSDGPNGDREVLEDLHLREDGWNRSATIGY